MYKYVKLNGGGSLLDAISLPSSAPPSRPLSAMSNATTKDPLWYFELAQEAEHLLSKSQSNVSDLDSSDVDASKNKTNEGNNLESHLSKSIQKHKIIKKDLELDLSKAKRNASKELHSLENSLQGIYKLQSKASIQQEKYQYKIESANGALSDLKSKASELEKTLNSLKHENNELEQEQTELNALISHKQGLLHQEEMQNQHILFEIESEKQQEEMNAHTLKLSLQRLQNQYESLIKDIQKLTQSDNPQGIPTYSKQLDAYKIRYQRQLEKFNQQEPRQALLHRQKEVELWKSAVEHARLRNQSLRLSLVI